MCGAEFWWKFFFSIIQGIIKQIIVCYQHIHLMREKMHWNLIFFSIISICWTMKRNMKIIIYRMFIESRPFLSEQKPGIQWKLFFERFNRFDCALYWKWIHKQIIDLTACLLIDVYVCVSLFKNIMPIVNKFHSCQCNNN